MKKVCTLVLVFLLLVSSVLLVGCSEKEDNDDNSTKKNATEGSAKESGDDGSDSDNDKEKPTTQGGTETSLLDTTKESPEEWFVWNGTAIRGLTEEGKKQTEFVIPSKCTSIMTAFYDNETIEKVAFAGTQVELMSSDFSGCTSLRVLQLPDGLVELPRVAARLPELTVLVMPDTVKTIEMDAFMECTKLSDITWSNSLETIEMHAFLDCTSLKSITFPESLRTLDVNCFCGCSGLTEVIFNEGLETIGREAFKYADGIETLRIPDSVKEIGSCAFAECRFKEVYLPDEVDLDPDDTFIQRSDELCIYVHEGSAMDELFNEDNKWIDQGFYTKAYY